MNFGSGEVTINNDGDNMADTYAALGGNGNIFAVEQSKIPNSIKSQTNNTFQVAQGNTVRYRGAVKSGMNVEGVKIISSHINFGDGTRKRSTTGWISHAYKTPGWKKITVTFNATFTKFDASGMGMGVVPGKIQDASAVYWVFVSRKPQLTLTRVQAGYTNARDFKRGNVNFLTLRVVNIGAVSTRPTRITIFYQDPKRVGKVDSKLRKFTKTVNLKALKSGKGATVRIAFSVPKKHASKVKNIRLDSANRNKNQISKASNLITFR